jgi:hypothetical protein
MNFKTIHPIWGPAPGCTVLHSAENKDPNHWWAPAGICHRHQTTGPLCLSCTTRGPHSQGADKAFVNGIREWSIKWQLLLWGERMVNEALRQTLEMWVVKLAVRSPVRLRKTSDRILWRSPHPEPNEENTGALAIFKSSVPMNRNKCRTQHDMEELFTKAITDVTAKCPWRRRNDDMSVGYSGWAALRGQCDMTAESWSSGT